MSGTLENLDDPIPVPAPDKPKHRSGYARIRTRHHYLIAEHEALKAEHERLQRHHEALKVGHAELQTAFDELLSIHNDLLSDLKRTSRVASTLSPNLMGQRHG